MKKLFIILILGLISLVVFGQTDQIYIEENVKLYQELTKYKVAKTHHTLTIEELEIKLKIHKKALKKTKRKIKKIENKIYDNKLKFDKDFKKEEEERQKIIFKETEYERY